MRKASIKTLRIKADTAFSKACFRKWGDKCLVCGKEATQVHHFVPKSISAYLRYNVLNGITLCYYCHIIRIHRQGDPLVYEAIIKKRGQAWFKKLKKLKVEGEKKGGYLNANYYQKKIKELNEID
jgi:5-methylcytosine-specific restriction endonuclease McrA